MSDPRPRDVTAFWASLQKTAAGCWLWTRGNSGPGRYGKVYLRWDAGAKRSVYGYAHRVAFEIVNGPIPEGVEVCHTCDNPPCCNPAHLFLGTHAENVADAGRKGHLARSVSGERNPARRLTLADVAAIRARHAGGVSMTALGRAFGVSRQGIGRVVKHQTWKEAVS